MKNFSLLHSRVGSLAQRLMVMFCVLMLGVTQVWGANVTGTFSKITSTTNLTTGYYVITGSESSSANTNAMGASVDGNGRLGYVAVTVSSGTSISNPNDATVYLITKTNDNYTFQNVSTGDYLYQASTTKGKGMGFRSTSANFTCAGYNTSSPIGFKFTLNGASYNIFKWNNSSKWFANYDGNYDAGMAPVRMFKAYKVTYDGNGKTGGSVPTDNTYYSGNGSTKVTTKTNSGSLTKTGYTFSGWNTLANGNGTSYAVSTQFTITANTTLYAKWICTTPTFSANLSTVQVDYDQNTTATALSVTASANGATLSYAWEKSSNGTSGWTSVGTNSSSYTPSTAETGDLYYRCTVTNAATGCSTSATSNTAHIHVNEAVACAAIPTVGAVSLNGPFSLTQVPLTSSVTNEGGTGCSISAVGFVWKAGSDPSASDNPKAGTYSNGTITGSLPSSGSFAANGTTYYIKAYATNGAGTAVSSSSFQFTPLSVTFDNQGHGSTPETQYLKSGDKAEDPNFTNITGYTFGGWFTNEGCTAGNEWDFTSNTVTLSNTTNGNLTLYAKWTVKTHVFDWSWAGGSTTSTTHTPANANMPYGTAITYPANNTMSKTGYNFTGWNSDATTMPDGDLTITAQWQAKTTAITLNKNNSDASGTEAGSASWTYDQTAKNSITAATRTGYTVNGYYTAASGGTKILNADGSLAGNAITVDAVVYTNDGKWAYNDTELTLYAQWSPITYTVAFDKNNTSASGSMDNQTGFTYGVGKQLSKNTFTIDASLHKYFAGWSKSSTATEPTYIDEQSVTDVATTSGTITLYAVWKDYTYTNYRIICCTKHDVTLADNGETEEGEWIVVPDRACVDVDVALEAEAKTGYEFAAWEVTKTSDESDITDAVIKSGSSKTNAEATIVMPDYGITVNATFSPLVYNITYKDKGDVAFSGTHETGYPETHTYNAATTLKGATKTDYNFIGWYDNADCDGEPVTSIAANSISADITLYAKWVEDNKWVVTISAPENGTIKVSYTEDETAKEFTSGSREILKNTEITITATGSTGYDCTSLTKDGEPYTSGTSMTLTSAITIAATFGLHTYDITYNLDGGNNNVGNPATYRYDTSDITLQDPTKTGYTFKGWYNNSDLAEEHKVTGVAITSGSAVDKEFWAKWEINKHAFAWEFDGGSTTSTTHTADNAQMPYNSEITYPEGTTMSKEGYHFTGWSSDATTMPDADLTITAQWEINTYTVTWHVDGDEWSSEIVEHGSTATLPEAPTKADGCGDKFMGWTTIEDYTGNGAPDPLYTTPPTITGNTNFYAVFADYGE